MYSTFHSNCICMDDSILLLFCLLFCFNISTPPSPMTFFIIFAVVAASHIWVEPGINLCNPLCGSSSNKCSTIHCGLKVCVAFLCVHSFSINVYGSVPHDRSLNPMTLSFYLLAYTLAPATLGYLRRTSPLCLTLSLRVKVLMSRRYPVKEETRMCGCKHLESLSAK